MVQVEEDNEAGLAFYDGLGFNTLFVDRAARRYDTSGFLLQNVRTSKLTMRKALDWRTSEPEDKAGDTFGDHLAHLFRFLAEPFVVRPPPSTRLPARSAASVENLFGPTGGGSGGGVRRRRGGSGGRVGSSRISRSEGSGGGGSGGSTATASSNGDGSSVVKARSVQSGSSSSSSSSSPSPSSPALEEVAPIRLHRTTRRR